MLFYIRNIFLSLIFLSSHSTIAQVDNNINYFTADLIGSKVWLSFQLKTGAICNGISVERRVYGSVYQVIGSIDGVCGAEDYPQTFNLEDSSPVKNQRVFYRLILNGLGVSQDLELFIPDLNDRTYTLALEPNTQQLALYFSNFERTNVSVQFYSASGGHYHSIETDENFVLLPDFIESNALCFFSVFDDFKVLRVHGKIFIP
jgi:hypothetical protein